MQQRDTERLARDTRSSALRGRIPRAALAGVLLTLGLAVAPGPAASQILVLDFEGLEDLEPVGDFYDGGVGGFGSGPGPDFDIVFSPNATYVIVVLTDFGFSDDGAGRIARLSRAVYDYYNGG